MTYIPKNRIITNLYTDGSEFVYVDSSKPYQGFYHKLYTNRFYTGKNQYDTPIKEIKKASLPSIIDAYTDVFLPTLDNKITTIFNTPNFFSSQYSFSTSSINYASLTGELEKPPLRELPLSTVILPNDSDYNKGGIIRYFARKNVNNSYIEISKTTFDNFSKESAKTKNLKYAIDVYSVYSIFWVLVGDLENVFNSNRNVVIGLQNNNKIKGLDGYLKFNFLQFYRYTPQTNLFTSGNELLTLNGESYSGYYHVDEIKGPIAGAFPSDGSQQLLRYRKYSPSLQYKKTTQNLGLD
jgi:hypothetical protein